MAGMYHQATGPMPHAELNIPNSTTTHMNLPPSSYQNSSESGMLAKTTNIFKPHPTHLYMQDPPRLRQEVKRLPATFCLLQWWVAQFNTNTHKHDSKMQQVKTQPQTAPDMVSFLHQANGTRTCAPGTNVANDHTV